MKNKCEIIKTFAIISSNYKMGCKILRCNHCGVCLIKDENKLILSKNGNYNVNLKCKYCKRKQGFTLVGNVNRDYNKDAMRRMKSILQDSKLYYVNIYGNYKKKEHSLLIINLSLEDAIYLSETFYQESFFFGVKNDDKFDITYYQQYRNSENEFIGNFKEVETIDNVKVLDNDTFNFFSARHNIKFSIPMKIFEGIDYCDNEELFNECINDKYTPKHRILIRAKLTTNRNYELNEIIPNRLIF